MTDQEILEARQLVELVGPDAGNHAERPHDPAANDDHSGACLHLSYLNFPSTGLLRYLPNVWKLPTPKTNAQFVATGSKNFTVESLRLA